MVSRMFPWKKKKKKSFLFASNVQIRTVRHIDKDNKYLYNQSTDQSSQEHQHIKQDIDITLPD